MDLVLYLVLETYRPRLQKRQLAAIMTGLFLNLQFCRDVPLKYCTSPNTTSIEDQRVINLYLHNQGFIEKKPQGGAKVEFIFFRGGNYKANQITFRLQTGVTVYVTYLL